MRFDTPIYFEREVKPEYDSVTGNYIEKAPEKVLRYASVTDSSTDTLTLVYGELRQGSLTIRLQNHYSAPFDRIRVGDKVYRKDMERKLRTKHTFVVSEVQ